MEWLLVFYVTMLIGGLYNFEGITIKNRRFAFNEDVAHIPSFVFAHVMLGVVVLICIGVLL